MKRGVRFVRCTMAVALLLASSAAAAAAQTVIVVRHAERADAGVQAAAGADPLLSLDGRQRAHALAEALAEAGVTAIYTTQYQRTRLTAEPLAVLLGITTVVAAAGADAAADAAALAARIRRDHANGTVLIVGHSNTVPAIIGAFGGPDIGRMPDTAYDGLFLLRLDGERALLVRARYGAVSK